jgi:hypothetical protein
MKRLLTTLVILTGLIGSGGTVWAQDLNKGLKAAQSGDFATALKEWKPLAEQGLALAQFNLGWMYDDGKGVTQDYAESAKWFRKGAEQGDAKSQRKLENLKIKFAQRWMDQCLFDNIEKVTGPETKSIVEKHCHRKIENKSVEWLARNVD